MNKLFLLMIFVVNFVLANVSLPPIFSDNMVLQRNSEVKIWGNATPKEEIIITTNWDNKQYKTVADSHANWNLKIQTQKEGGPYSISIKGYNEIILKNVMVGEVWLCSGQSNMEMTPNWGIENGDQEIKNATNPNIRFFNVTKSTSDFPQKSLIGNWQESNPETMKNNSAIAYFFAQQMQKYLGNIPIGLIISAWGGTPAEVWMPEESFKQNPLALEEAKKLQPTEYCPSEISKTFNSMINPLVGYKIKGVLWYQGERNRGSSTYENTFSQLIKSWRNLWNEDFPFYFVQISPYNYCDSYDGGVKIRDAQRRTLKLSNTAMVITSDISTIDDIHPKKKKEVGVRLANIALQNLYQFKNGLVNSPLYKDFSVKGNKMTVNFENSDGLYFKNKTCNFFEIAGDDKKFHKANAYIKGNQVVLYSKEVKLPKYVRYAWKNTAQSDLYNNANLPASSFTTEF